MDSATMGHPIAIPRPFRGLRILLLDNDTSSLLDIASNLEDYSYLVTTTEIPTIALSILQERADHFDLVMADINMPEMDCLKFIKSVQVIKDYPIILMSAEVKKDMVEEAMTKGACFFLKKPISSKNLKNVWQHVYRKNKYENSSGRKAETNQEAKVHGKSNAIETVDEGTSEGPGNEKIGDSEENDLEGVDKKMLTNKTGICKKRSFSPENDEAGALKRKRTEDERIKSSRIISGLSAESGYVHKRVDRTSEQDENKEFTDSFTFLELLEETDTIKGSNFCEDSHLQTKFLMTEADVNQKMDLVKELGSSTSREGEKD